MKNMANENVMADLINDGSPFGVIFIADNDKLIEKLRLIERICWDYIHRWQQS